MPITLPIINLKDATFECTFGRGCDGRCCREGRPVVFADEIEIIEGNLARFLPHLRPEARAVAQTRGFATAARQRTGQRHLRVVQGWCIFFNQGCVLHQVGAAEGDKFRYKPCVCALFPIELDQHDQWYVRQKDYKRERWDLFCLDPCNSPVRAEESLGEEIALAQRIDDEMKAAVIAERSAPVPAASLRSTAG